MLHSIEIALKLDMLHSIEIALKLGDRDLVLLRGLGRLGNPLLSCR